MFLVIVGSYSKWVEVFSVSNSTSQTIINCLRTCFGTHGLSQIYVSDNGVCFASEEFERFMKKNVMLHIKSPPYHPATNRYAERLRTFRTFKNIFRKIEGSGSFTKDLSVCLCTELHYKVPPVFCLLNS